MSGENERLHIEITGSNEDLKLAARGAVSAIRDVAQETKRADAQIVASNEAASASLKKLEDRQAGLAQASRNFGASWRAIGWASLVAEIGPATSAVSDLGVGLAGAAEAAAPLAGVVATLPNLIGAAGQAGIVAKLAFSGMGKALEGDQKALEALSPAAQKFVTTIRGEVGPVIKDLQKQSQAGLLPGLTKGIEDLVKDAPVIKTIVRDTADELGSLAEKTGAALSTKGFQSDLAQFGKTNVIVIHDLGDAALHLGEGFREIVDAAQPLTRDLAGLARTISVDLEGAIVHARNSGDLKAFFDLTDTRVHQSLQVAKDFAVVLINVGKAAQPLGDQLAGGLVSGMDKLAHLTAGPGLGRFFQGAEEPLHQVGLLARDLAIDLGKLASSGQDPLSHLASTLRLDVLPTLSDLAQLLTTDVSPELSNLLSDVGKLAHDALPGIHAAMPVVQGLADALGAALKAADGLEQQLPGVTKLLVPLGVFFGGKAALGVPGKLAGGISNGIKQAAGLTPADPMWVAVVNGMPGISGSGASTVVKTAAKDAESAAETGAGAGGVGGLLKGAGRGAAVAGASVAAGAATGLAVGGGIKALSDLMKGEKGLSSDIGILQRYRAELDKLAATGDKGGMRKLAADLRAAALDAQSLTAGKDLTGLADALDQAAQTGNGGGLAKVADALNRVKVTGDSGAIGAIAADLRKLAGERGLQQIAGQAENVGPIFQEMKTAAGGSLTDIRTTLRLTTQQIRDKLGSDTAAGKDALAHNFDLAAGAIKASMDAGVISTKTGLAEIQKLFADALKEYGFDSATAKNLAKNGVTVQQLGKVQAGSGGSTGGLGQTHGAAGGMVQIGRPGEAGRDDVPAMLNGQPAVIARGEVVSVFNRHQMAGLDAMASHAGYGGLRGFMASQPKNYMAGGGIIPAAGGGFFPAAGTDYSYGQEPEIARRLDAMAQALGLHLTGISGHRTPQHSVEVGGFADDPHTRGQASDTPGVEGVSEAILRKYGLTRPFAGAREADHIQLLGGKGGGAAAGAALQGAVDAIAQVNFPTGLGAVSALGQASLDTIRAAANQKLSTIVGAAAPGGGGSALASIVAGASGSGRALMEHIAAARGWNFADWWALDASETSHGANLANPTSTARLRGQFLSSNYGKYGPGSDPGQNPTMDQQIESMAAYIADRYGDPTKAWAFHQAHNWYSGGGLIHADDGVVARAASASGIGQAILGTANPVTPDKSKTKKKAAKKRPGKPFAGGPAMPDVSKVKARVKKKAAHKLPKWLKAFQGKIPDDLKAIAPDLQTLFEQPIADMQQALTNQDGRNQLTDEQPTVTLYDSDQFADLTNYLTAHPEVLHGLSPGAWMDKYGDSLEVVNQGGMNVQGTYVRGIAQAVAEIDSLLTLHGDAGHPKTLRGLLAGELVAANGGQGRLAKEGFQVGSELAQLQATWEADQRLLAHNRDRLGKLDSGPGTWQQRVADNTAKIDVLEEYLRNLRSAAVGHRLTTEAQRDRQTAENKISALRGENTKLRKDKPAPKKGSKQATAHVRAEVAKLHAEDSDLVADMNAIAGSTTDFSSAGADTPAGQRVARASSISELLKTFGDTIHRLSLTDIPQEDLAISQLYKDRGDLTGTTIAPAAVQRGTAADNSQLADLLKQQLETAAKQHAIDQSDLSTFQGFSPLVAGRMVGAFAHGTMRVPATGLALVHQDEMIVPDPQGPYGSQLAPQQVAGAAPAPVQVVVQVAGDMAPFIRVVDARIDGRSARVTSQDLGSKQRLLTVAPGR